MHSALRFRVLGLLMTLFLLAGCATSPGKHEFSHPDPLEGFNRVMFDINYKFLDPYLLRPVAVVWRDYVPDPARNGIHNFLSNLEEPASMVNYLLRGDFYKAAIHFNRFFLNTVFGMGGFIDVAAMANPKLAPEKHARFGQTLGHYGAGYGPYFMLPGYGPATLRDEGGKWADALYPLLSSLTWWMSAGKWVLEGIESRAQFLDTEDILHSSKDPYATLRDAYFQNHDFMVSGGASKVSDNPNTDVVDDMLDDID